MYIKKVDEVEKNPQLSKVKDQENKLLKKIRFKRGTLDDFRKYISERVKENE